MAKKMAYTDPNTGAEFPASVWLPVGVYIDASGPSVKIDFLGYKDQATASKMLLTSLGMMEPEERRLGAVGTASFTLTQEQFAQFFMSPPDGATLGDAITNACYAIAEQSEQNRRPDPANEGQTLHFFQGAEEVTVLSAPAATEGKPRAKKKH